MSHSPFALTVVLTIEGSKEMERDLHQRFGHLHIHHEWYQVDEGLFDFICENLLEQDIMDESEYDRLAEILGLNNQMGNYRETMEEMEEWAAIDIDHRVDNWRATIYERVPEEHSYIKPRTIGKKYNKTTQAMVEQLPCSGQTLIDTVKRVAPEVLYPTNLVRQFIKKYLKKGSIRRFNDSTSVG